MTLILAWIESLHQTRHETFYVAWGFVGLSGGEHVRHHLGVDVFGSWVHVVEGLLLLGVWINHRRVASERTGVLLQRT